LSDYLQVNRLEFAITYRCNSHCKHCHVGEAQRRSTPSAIDQALAVDIVQRVAAAYDMRSIMTFGGEPLLYPEVVCAIHAAATQAGIPHRSIITNAGTPRAPDRSRHVARRLAASGVTDVHISVDGFHQEHVPLDAVEANVRAYVEAGIPRLVWNPCWLGSRADDNEWNQRTRAVLEALAHLPVEEDQGNVVQPDGNAQRWLAPYLPDPIPLPSGTCEDVPYGGRLDQVECISIEPGGEVSVCWDWTIGTAVPGTIVELLEAYDPYAIPEAAAVLEGGIPALAALCRERGVTRDTAGYYSICDACRSLRRALKR
jgi:hypothetical protein